MASRVRVTFLACGLVILTGIALGPATLPSLAAQQLTIVEWRRAEVQLYESPGGRSERLPIAALPPHVDVDVVQDPFYRFTDPHTGKSWYVLQTDVKTNAILPAQGAVHNDSVLPSCQIAAGMNAARGCAR